MTEVGRIPGMADGSEQGVDGERPAQAEVIVVTELGYTPSTQRIRASGTDITHWGVTLLQAPFFEKDGKRRAETLPGGTLVEQTAATSSSKGEMALCRFWRGSGWAGPFLVATADLVRFPGGRDEVDADELEVLLRYAELKCRDWHDAGRPVGPVHHQPQGGPPVWPGSGGGVGLSHQ